MSLLGELQRRNVFNDESLGAREIARTLGAAYVLAGRVRQADDQVRINAQLIDARGRHIWAELYDRDLHDIFAVQDEIRHQIIICRRLH